VKRTKSVKLEMQKREITTNTKKIQGIIRDYFENLYSNKFENLEEMTKFLDTNDHSKLNQEDITHLNISIT
jgi:DNA integrity scanning protein DisA with diadenylate cyclase activity